MVSCPTRSKNLERTLIVISCVIKKYLNNVVAGSKNVEITPSIHPLFIFSFASWSKVLLTKFCDGLFFFFRGSKLYNSEALLFTYGQYDVIELADKLYNSVTVCFCASQKYAFHIGCKLEPNAE